MRWESLIYCGRVRGRKIFTVSGLRDMASLRDMARQGNLRDMARPGNLRDMGRRRRLEAIRLRVRPNASIRQRKLLVKVQGMAEKADMKHNKVPSLFATAT